MIEVQFHVNDQTCVVGEDDQTNLALFIRNQLKLKGTRYGCGEEQCGACLVLVNGIPKTSCQIEVGHLDGRHVETIEGILETPIGSVLLEEFERLQAAQCAFCISGIIVRASAALRANESANGSNRVKRELDGHLCRCGAHPRILAAIDAARQRIEAGQ